MDGPVISNNSICQPCYENNITSKLVEYKPDPSHFMVCPYCDNIVSKKLMRHMNDDAQPMGYKGSGKAHFEVLERSKRRRIKHREDNDVFNVDDYKLAGQEDKDLRYFANQGFVVSVTDSGNYAIEEQEEY